MLTHKPWNPESLLWLGCTFMLALAPGAAIAGLFEDGSVAQMAANVTVLPVAILVAVTVWFQVNRRFYQSSDQLGRCLRLQPQKHRPLPAARLGDRLVLVLIAMALALMSSLADSGFRGSG